MVLRDMHLARNATIFASRYSNGKFALHCNALITSSYFAVRALGFDTLIREQEPQVELAYATGIAETQVVQHAFTPRHPLPSVSSTQLLIIQLPDIPI